MNWQHNNTRPAACFHKSVFPACLAPFFRFRRVQLKQKWRVQLESCPEPPSNLSAYLSPDPVQTMLTSLRCTNQNTSHYTVATWEGRETEAEETRRKVTQREKGEEEFPGLKHHVGLLLLKSQSHQMMCSLCWPPSRLLFSLLYCFHSLDSTGCTASTIQCPQTKSIYWDREGAPEAPEAPWAPEVQDTRAVLTVWGEGSGGAGRGHRTLRFSLQIGDRIPEHLGWTWGAIVKSDKSQLRLRDSAH